MTLAELIAKVREIAQRGIEADLWAPGKQEGDEWLGALEEIVVLLTAYQLAAKEAAVSVELLERIERHLELFCDHLDGPCGPLPSEIEARNMLADLRLDVLQPFARAEAEAEEKRP